MNKLSLKAKLIAGALALTLTMAGFFGYLLFGVMSSQREATTSNYLNIMSSQADRLSNGIAAQFYERYGDIQAFAVNAVMQSGDPAAIQAALDIYVPLYGLYDVILLVDPTGKYIASNTKTTLGEAVNVESIKSQNYADEPWFKNAVAGHYTEDKAKNFAGTFFEDAHFDPILGTAVGTARLGTSFSTQVKDADGNLLGVITNRAHFKWVEGEYENLYRVLSEAGMKEVHMYLLNKEGQELVDYAPALHNNEVAIQRDPAVLLKKNLAQLGIPAAMKAIAGASGSTLEVDPQTNAEEFSGYSFLDTPKFIASIGWGTMVSYPKSAVTIFGDLDAARRSFAIQMLLLTVVSAMAALWVAKKLSTSLVQIAEQLRENVQATITTSNDLKSTAQSVAESSTEQAAAVQETVASMSEMTSMIAQTNNFAKDSLAQAVKVTDRTDEGSRTMERMVSSMEAVQQANAQLYEMVNIINEISSKTAVINDIVFKTQLLSFNASIEAARAGQHGRGFAVVAEEVGNLAEMSGTSAKEIQTLLEQSQKQVSQIVESIKARVTEGQSVSVEALNTFNEIAKDVRTISSHIQSINDATREQEAGVAQTAAAMTQMDESTQRNNQVAFQTSDLAGTINDQSVILTEIMQGLRGFVLGAGSAVEANPTTASGHRTNAAPRNARAPRPPGNQGADLKGVAGRLASRNSNGKAAATKNGKTRVVELREGQVLADDESFRPLV